METNFDCIVVGAGPAGLSAALNLRQRGKTVLVVHSGETLLAKAEQVDNYLGMPGLSGKQMMERFTQHARDAGAVLRKGRAGNVMPFGGRFMVNLDGDILETGAVVLACGVSKAKPVPGEAELLGRGVSYCATCDAGFFRNKAVYVAGSNSIAVEEALYLTGFAREVTLLCGRERLSAPKALQERAFAQPKLHILWNTAVAEVGGSGSAVLDRMVLKDTENGAETVVQAERQDGFFGLFGFLGFQPSSRLFADVLDTDGGYLVTDEEMHTKLPGVFAAGDIRKKSLRQVVTAAADGAIAAVQAEKYLRKSSLI